MNNADDDADGIVDEPLPAGSEDWDCDGDGYAGSAEAHVFSGATDRDQLPCGTGAWPADLSTGGTLDSTDSVTLTDLTSFLAPIRHLGTDG